MTIDIQNIEALLKEKKYQDVKGIIKSAVEEKMTDQEKGNALVEMAKVYMEITNSLNSAYRDALKEAVASLESLDCFGWKANDEIRLKEVRQELNS